MIVVMKPRSSRAQIDRVLTHVQGAGCRADLSTGEDRAVIRVSGDVCTLDRQQIERMEGVERTMSISPPYRLAGREKGPRDTVVDVGGVRIGGRQVVVMAGPCAVESEGRLREAARAVQRAGARVLRGGAFKMRTSPYSFQGLGEAGLEIMARVGRETGLPIVTEVTEAQTVPLVARYADMLQVGARSMQNYALLHAVGEAGRPVLLKRGMMATLDELLMAAEYVLSHGNEQVVLCERGIRSFEHRTRNTLDLGAVPVLQQLSHLPVVVDPSHALGRWEWVEAMARAAVAAGADGLLIEVHPRPETALSDALQALDPAQFAALMQGLQPVAEAVGRTL